MYNDNNMNMMQNNMNNNFMYMNNGMNMAQNNQMNFNPMQQQMVMQLQMQM